MDRILSGTVWPIGVLVAGLLAEASLLGVGIDDLDEGYFVQQAVRVVHGQVPYRDFESLYTPGLIYLHAALFALGGGPTLLSPRILAWLGRAGLVLMLYVLSRPLVRNGWWAAVPGLLLLVFDDVPVRWEPHPGWLSSLLALVATWCMTRASSGRWLLTAGTAAAGAYAFKQNTGVLILIAVLVWSGRGRWRLPLAAFGVATLAWIAPLLVALGGNIGHLGVIVGVVNQEGLVSAPEPTILIPLAALGGGVWLLRRDSHPSLRLYLVAGTALFLTELPRMDTPHLLWSAPLLLVLGTVALERLPGRYALASVTAVFILLWPTVSERVAYLGVPRAAVDGVVARRETVDDIQSTIDDIRQRTRPGEPIFAYPTSPLVYVLSERPNPTRFDHLNPGAASPTQIQAVIADLQRADVRLVVISDFWRTSWGPPGPNAPLEEWIATHYVEVARHGTYRLLAAG